jgi:hypothetical protein
MSRTLLFGGGVVIMLLLALSGCYLPPSEPIPSLTPTQTATLTPSPVWFPATATPTQLPTLVRSPTPDLRLGVGDLIVQNGFVSEEDWYQLAGDIGNISFSSRRINLAINEPPGLIFAYRETPILSDFYAEVTAEVNFCQGNDEYGMMVRVGSPRPDHFRFAFECDGEVKVTQIRGNSGSILEPQVQDAAIPVGFPGEIRLGVWALGEEIRFFLNDRYLFSIEDRVIGEGALGVYLRAREDNPMSVTFSELEIRELIP